MVVGGLWFVVVVRGCPFPRSLLVSGWLWAGLSLHAQGGRLRRWWKWYMMVAVVVCSGSGS